MLFPTLITVVPVDGSACKLKGGRTTAFKVITPPVSLVRAA